MTKNMTTNVGRITSSGAVELTTTYDGIMGGIIGLTDLYSFVDLSQNLVSKVM